MGQIKRVVANLHRVEVKKDKKGKVTGFDKKDIVRNDVKLGENEVDAFNESSKFSCQRYYIDEAKTKERNEAHAKRDDESVELNDESKES